MAYRKNFSLLIFFSFFFLNKSWYSWTLNSLVNGIYAFGFLFMLPQLFVNYKLKSVAALPWRAFMYKAFNTFIDDVFAFVISMPTAHRIACFRDDIVFIIYLVRNTFNCFKINILFKRTSFYLLFLKKYFSISDGCIQLTKIDWIMDTRN